MGHEAWSTSCKIKQTEKRKAEAIMSNQALLYPIDATQELISFGPIFSNFQGSSAIDLTLQASEIPLTWTITAGKKRKNNLAHTSKLRSTPLPSGKKITWADTGIMNLENMAKALSKPILGRP